MHTTVAKLILFLDVILVGLVAGTVFGIWIGFNPVGLSAEVYVAQQQHTIRALNVLMPVLGLIAIVLTLVSAFLCKQNKFAFSVLTLGAALLILSGLVTRFGNQPINAIVITWDLNSIPEEWESLRNQWWTYHAVRTLASTIAFACVAWVGVWRVTNE